MDDVIRLKPEEARQEEKAQRMARFLGFAAAGTSVLVTAYFLWRMLMPYALLDGLVEGAAAGDRARVRSLLQQGARVNLRSRGGPTALMNAAAGNQPAMVADLLRYGADVNMKDAAGRTALDYARQSRNPTIIRMLEDAATEATRRNTPSIVP